MQIKLSREHARVTYLLRRFVALLLRCTVLNLSEKIKIVDPIRANLERFLLAHGYTSLFTQKSLEPANKFLAEWHGG